MLYSDVLVTEAREEVANPSRDGTAHGPSVVTDRIQVDIALLTARPCADDKLDAAAELRAIDGVDEGALKRRAPVVLPSRCADLLHSDPAVSATNPSREDGPLVDDEPASPDRCVIRERDVNHPAVLVGQPMLDHR